MANEVHAAAAKSGRKARLIVDIRPETKAAIVASAEALGVSVSDFVEATVMARFDGATVIAETEKLLAYEAATQRAIISIAETLFRVKSTENDGVAGRYGNGFKAA